MKDFRLYIPKLKHSATEADIERFICLLHKRTAVSIPDREYWKLRKHPKVQERLNQRINECLLIQMKLGGIINNQVSFALSRLGKTANPDEVAELRKQGDEAVKLVDSAVRSLSNGVSWRHVGKEKRKADKLLTEIHNVGRS